MIRRISLLAAVGVLAACNGDGPTPPIPAQCAVSVADVSSNPASTAPSPPQGSPMQQLVDDFAGPAVNSNRWSPYDPETQTLTLQDDRLVIDVRANARDYSGLLYRLPHSFAGSGFFAEVSAAATGGSLVETVVGVASADEEEFILLTSFGIELQAVYNWRDRGCNHPSHERSFQGITYCELGSITFNETAHRFRRLREQGGSVTLELSADGATWQQPDGWSLTHHFADAGALHGLLAAGTPAPYANTTAARFENVNTTVPAIPRGIGASCPSDSEVRLTWDRRSVNEAGFRIERRVGGGAFAEIGTVGAGTREFVDASTQGGRTYQYRVRGASEAGNSGYSRAVTVTR